MKSVKDIYKIGKGPSSSHTMGPFKAVRHFMEQHPDASGLHVVLFGSLAATGRGHLTDVAIEEAFSTWRQTDKESLGSDERRKGNVTIEWKPKENLPFHPNGMQVGAVNEDGSIGDRWTYYSIGGGDIVCDECPIGEEEDVPGYKITTLREIKYWCINTGKTYWEYVMECEGKDSGVWEHLKLVWKVSSL